MRRGRTQRAVIRALRAAGTPLDLRTLVQQVYGHATPAALEATRRACHRLAARGAIALAYQRPGGRLVARLRNQPAPARTAADRPVRPWMRTVRDLLVPVVAGLTDHDVARWLRQAGRDTPYQRWKSDLRAGHTARWSGWVPAQLAVEQLAARCGLGPYDDWSGLRRAVRRVLAELAEAGTVALRENPDRRPGRRHVVAVRLLVREGVTPLPPLPVEHVGRPRPALRVAPAVALGAVRRDHAAAVASQRTARVPTNTS